MARLPLTEQEVSATKVVIKFGKVGLTDEQFWQLCWDFVAEIRSPRDTLKELQEKMAEYIANGAQQGWLIDPYKPAVYIYRPGEPVKRLDNPTSISGDPVLPGFVFNVAEIW